MKSVMITGSTSGIGEALFKLYCAESYHVIACGRNKTKLDSYQLSHQLNNQHMQTLAFDITQPNEIKNAAKHVSTIDILILNAGDCAYLDDINNFDAELFARIINTNLISLGYLLQYFLPKLSTGGQVVFISSSATLLPFPKAEAYGASKAGINYLANSLRVDLAATHIDVTLVQPGFIQTPLTNKNTFDMPFMISSDRAARLIYEGIDKRKKLLQFPRRLIILLKILAFLPTAFWIGLITRSSTS